MSLRLLLESLNSQIQKQMINIFRQIRKELMETGKTGKYFKYAIGEIILVVIGIFNLIKTD